MNSSSGWIENKRTTDLGGAHDRHSRNIKQGDFEPGRPALLKLGR
jgi:hypothetical protein